MAGPSQTADRVEILISAEEIAARIAQLADDIAASDPVDLLVVPILMGGFVFAADLIRSLHAAGLNPEIDLLMLSSYRDGTSSSGHIEMLRDIDSAPAGRDVLLVDDILDSGRTLSHAKTLMESRGARAVSTCVLLDKPVTRAAAIVPDFTGFACPNTFVVGYGMDLDHRFRELPFIGRIMQDSS
jgi:hypoxanthine phosphoribosyltransferase